MSSSFDDIASEVETRFQEGRRVLSFAEYLDLFQKDPARFGRDASHYVRDALDHYGTREVQYPWGSYRRFNLFDAPWNSPSEAVSVRPGDPVRQGVLIGQEHVQEEMYRALSNFVKEGRPTRLVLLHGPNGSAKSTAVGCLLRGLEHYSTQDAGALYCFHWVFPSNAVVRGTLGFSGKTGATVDTYAHLQDTEIDAKLMNEVRDHPLFLIPKVDRAKFLLQHFPSAPPNDWLLRGELSSKSQQVFEALLTNYKGSYRDVLKHVQVVRYFVSQRYRRGAVTLGPQMSMDAGERQITADRSLGSLPASLQALSLYETHGELVEAAGGVLEFSDLLKRPLDAYKYLQLTVETQEVSLGSQNVQLNCVLMGSANELHLDAFRQHPEFASFRGRIEPIRTPYLRSYLQEQQIYDTLVIPHVRKHVAPHATEMAALFAVLTRMQKPQPSLYPEDSRPTIGSLTAFEKAMLYATGKAPARLDTDAAKVLRTQVGALYHEESGDRPYEGRIGASPREIRTVLLDAAQSAQYTSLSPLAVLATLADLAKRTTEFEWLQQDKLEGGYHDVPLMLAELREHLLDHWEREVFVASGLIEEHRYEELFDRYVQNVSAWVKSERLHNKVTGDDDEPDETLMKEVEGLMGIKSDFETSRKQMISEVAAFAIEHPGAKIDVPRVFGSRLAKMRATIFESKLPAVAACLQDAVMLVRGEGSGLDKARRTQAEAALAKMGALGHTRDSAADAMATYWSERLRPKLAAAKLAT
jgi:serine protein kinase